MGILVYLLSIPLAGMAVLTLIARSRRWRWGEMLGVSVMLGLGSCGIQMFYLSLLGVKPSPVQSWITIAASLLVLLIFRPKMAARASTSRQPMLQIIPLALLVLALAGNIVLARREGFERGDALTIWGTKGRALSVQSLASRPPVFYAPDFHASHHNYPLLLPMLIAGAYQGAGRFDDSAAKLVFPLMLLGASLVAWFGLRRLTSPGMAAWLTAAWIASPAMVVWSSIGYADALLAMFALGAALYLGAYARNGEPADVWIAALCGAFAAFTKNEGAALALVILVSAGAWIIRSKAQMRLFLRAAGVAFLLVVPWLVFRATLPADDENYPGRLVPATILHNIDRTGAVIVAFGRQMSSVSSWGLIWLAIPVALAIRPRALTHRWTRFIWTALILQLATYTLAYIIAPSNLTDLLDVTVQRLLVQVSPLAVILLSLHLGPDPEPEETPDLA
jgi:hypothetical protein